MRNILIVIVLLLSFSAVSLGQDRVASGSQTNRSTELILTSPFRYTIIAETSKIQTSVNSGGDYRHIVVLMHDEAFNEQNLRTLFSLLSKRYQDKTGLYARVFTSLDAVPTPEEYDRMDLYGPLENYRQFKNAYFSRDRRGNVITYDIPGGIEGRYIYIGPPQK